MVFCFLFGFLAIGFFVLIGMFIYDMTKGIAPVSQPAQRGRNKPLDKNAHTISTGPRLERAVERPHTMSLLEAPCLNVTSESPRKARDNKPSTASNKTRRSAKPVTIIKKPPQKTTQTAESWQQEFFSQLALMAQAEKCFIYNPKKEINPKTPRLEIREKSLTHTAWNLTDTRVRLTFYTAKSKREARAETAANDRRFRALRAHKEQIEREFGETLVWDYEEGRRDQYVDSLPAVRAKASNRSQWPKIQADMIDRTNRLGAVLKPYLNLLDNPLALKKEIKHASVSKVTAAIKPTPSKVVSTRKPKRAVASSSRASVVKQPTFDPEELMI